jgi:hypothetical protein
VRSRAAAGIMEGKRRRTVYEVFDARHRRCRLSLCRRAVNPTSERRATVSRTVWILLSAFVLSFAFTGCRAEVDIDKPDDIDAPGEPDGDVDGDVDGQVGD